MQLPYVVRPPSPCVPWSMQPTSATNEGAAAIAYTFTALAMDTIGSIRVEGTCHVSYNPYNSAQSEHVP